jgi:hypothetical protein
MGEEAEVNIEMVEASLETIPEVYHRENFDPLKQVNLDRRPCLGPGGFDNGCVLCMLQLNHACLPAHILL